MFLAFNLIQNKYVNSEILSMSGIDEDLLNAQFIEKQIGPLPWDNKTESESAVVCDADQAAVSNGIYSNDSSRKGMPITSISDEREIKSENKIVDAGFDNEIQSKKSFFNSTKEEVANCCKFSTYELHTPLDIAEKPYEPSFGIKETPINKLLDKALYTNEFKTPKEEIFGKAASDTSKLVAKSECKNSDDMGGNAKQISASSLKITRSMVVESKMGYLETHESGMNHDLIEVKISDRSTSLSREKYGKDQKKEMLKSDQETSDKIQDVKLQLQPTKVIDINDGKRKDNEATKKTDLSDEQKEVDPDVDVDVHLDELLLLTQDVASLKWPGVNTKSQAHTCSTTKPTHSTVQIPAHSNINGNEINKNPELQPIVEQFRKDDYTKGKRRDSCIYRSSVRDDRDSHKEHDQVQALRSTRIKIKKEPNTTRNIIKKNIESDGQLWKGSAKCFSDMDGKDGEIKGNQMTETKPQSKELKHSKKKYTAKIDRTRLRKHSKVPDANDITRPIVDDDVYDISPVKNREWLSDSDCENKTSDTGTNGQGAYEVSRKKSDTGTYILRPDKDNPYFTTGGDVQRGNDILEMNLYFETVDKRNAKKGKRKKRTGLTKRRKEDSTKVNSGLDYQQSTTVKNLKETSNEERRQIKSVTTQNATRRLNEYNRKDYLSMETQTGHPTPSMKAEESDEDREVYCKSKRDEIDVELGDLMYDSDTDITSGSAFGEGSPSIQSRDLIFPSPISNRTFVITESEGDSTNVEDVEGMNDRHMVTTVGDIENTTEQKKGRFERLLRWLCCCLKPSGDE